jgi:hypothetical protein
MQVQYPEDERHCGAICFGYVNNPVVDPLATSVVEPITGLWSAYKLSCGWAIIICGLAIINPVVSEVKSEISLFTSLFLFFLLKFVCVVFIETI